MSKFQTFIDNYVKGKDHCDSCPYSWEEKTSYEYDEWDQGCYINGDLQHRCMLLPPIRGIIGKLKKNKYHYYANHQYDNIGDWYEDDMKKQRYFESLIYEFLQPYDLCCKNKDGEYIPISKQSVIKQEAWRVRSNYEDFAHKTVYIPIKKQWSELLKITWQNFTRKFKPYFCK